MDALVIPVSMEKKWQSAYGTFLLAKQAGFEVEFATVCNEEIPDYPFYILSGPDNGSSISRSFYLALLEKVEKGASLLVTDCGKGIVHSFKQVFGCKIEYTCLTSSVRTVCDPAYGEILIQNPATRVITACSAQVLLVAKEDASPVLTVNPYGKGKIFYLAATPEMTVLEEKEPERYHIY